MDAVEAMIAHRLVEARHPASAWRFAHAMVREALLRSADEAGRLQELHRWVLEDLERQPDIDPEEHARHLLGAGRVSEAVGRWVAAARRHSEQGHPHAVLDMLDRAERALATDAELQARWSRELDVGRVRAYLMLGRLDEAESTANAAREYFKDTPDHPDLAAVQTLLARVAFLRGDHAGAEQLAREVIAQLRPADDLAPTDPERLADALRVVGLVEMGRDLAQSERTLRDSLAWAKQAGAGPLWAETAGFLATALGYQDRFGEAATVLQEALDSPHSASRALRGSLLNTQAELLRSAGEITQAERAYRESVRLLEQVGSLEAAVPRLNLAILAAQAQRYDDAWSLAERCGHESTVQGRPPLMVAVRAVLLAAAIGLEHDEVAVDQAEQLIALDASGVRTEREVYDILHDAGSMLVQRGLTDVGMKVLTTADARIQERRGPS
jgi:tetratricopeptide (TPR) repeat protein